MGDAARRLGWDDYQAFPDDGVRRQILDGEVVVSPSPTRRHQQLAGHVYWLFKDYLRVNPLGEALISPVAVRLPSGDVVEPDVVYLSHDNLAAGDSPTIDAPPDLLVEVLSPSNRGHDLVRKRRVYEAAGVAEYWIVDPEGESVTRLVLEGEHYVADGPAFAEPGSSVSTPLLPGFELDVAALFADSAPKKPAAT